jgi:hypothetical protein
MNKQIRNNLKTIAQNLPPKVDGFPVKNKRVNHFRRLKNAYTRKGTDGVKEYYDQNQY